MMAEFLLLAPTSEPSLKLINEVEDKKNICYSNREFECNKTCNF